MDIEKLRRKRQLNVQEQNALDKDGILNSATHWRGVGVPIGLQRFFKTKGIQPDTSIFLDYQQNFPGMGSDWGEVLTADGKFFSFEMDLSEDRTKIVELFEWADITETIEINESKPGTGATRGYLALEVLSELNQC